eukprot:Em0002g346a
MADKPLNMTTRYFTIFPDDIIPVWTQYGIPAKSSCQKEYLYRDKCTESRRDAAPAGPGDQDYPKNRMNDGKCDARGGYVTHKLTQKVTDGCVSNGMAWSPGNTKMYHMDSGLRKLWSFNFDDVSSCLTNRQVCWWTSMTRGWGIQDAMCTDSEGGCGGRCSLEPPFSWWDPAIGELLAKIEFPAPRMMSCCFRGPDFSGCLSPTLH